MKNRVNRRAVGQLPRGFLAFDDDGVVVVAAASEFDLKNTEIN